MLSTITERMLLRGGGSFSQLRGDRKRGNGLRLLDIRKNLLAVKVIGHWNRLLKEVVESSSLELIRMDVDMTLEDMV